MTDAVLRHAVSADLPALKNLWLAAYPGDEPYAALFFQHAFRPESTYVVEENGRLCSMFFSLKGFRFHDGSQALSASYLYALGTDPACRGRGYGKKLTVFSASEDYRQGTDLVFLQPASDSLRNWYHHTSGTSDFFFRRRIQISPGTVADAQKEEGNRISAGTASTASFFDSIREISPETYCSFRAQFLSGTGHMEIPLPVLKLQRDFCRLSDGGLFELKINGKTGICLGDREDSHLILRELLLPDGDPVSAARTVMQKMHCTGATVYTPAFWHRNLGTVMPTCVLLPGSTMPPEPGNLPYWGALLD